jgi:hypothetical protein
MTDPIRAPFPDSDDRLDGVPIPADLAHLLANSPIGTVTPLPLRLGDHDLGWWVVEQVDASFGRRHRNGYYVQLRRVEAPPPPPPPTGWDGTVRAS